jgi:hypothetical protein
MMRLTRSMPIPAGILSCLHANPGHTRIVTWAVVTAITIRPGADTYATRLTAP